MKLSPDNAFRVFALVVLIFVIWRVLLNVEALEKQDVRIQALEAK